MRAFQSGLTEEEVPSRTGGTFELQPRYKEIRAKGHLACLLMFLLVRALHPLLLLPYPCTRGHHNSLGVSLASSTQLGLQRHLVYGQSSYQVLSFSSLQVTVDGIALPLLYKPFQ